MKKIKSISFADLIFTITCWLPISFGIGASINRYTKDFWLVMWTGLFVFSVLIWISVIIKLLWKIIDCINEKEKEE